MKTQEQIQDDRYERLKVYIGDLEIEAYGLTIGAPEKAVEAMADKADVALDKVLAYYELSYFNPGEPVAEKDTYEVRYFEDQVKPSLVQYEAGQDRACSIVKHGKIMIPLTSTNAGNNGGMRTREEEEAELAADTDLLPSDLYWARLRLQQASDILEHGWAHGLTEPPAHEPFVLDLED